MKPEYLNRARTVANRPAVEITDRWAVFMRAASGHLKASRTAGWLAFAVCVVLLAGCATTSTTVGRVWQDPARAHTPMGKTLVVALLSDTEVAVPIEDEWASQLGSRGVEAKRANVLLPDQHPPDKQSVVDLVKAEGFDTLLVVELVKVKKVEKDVSATQVAVVDTKLYDTRTEQMFWSARSDTFWVTDKDGRVTKPRSVHIRWFVETIIKAMSKSKVL